MVLANATDTISQKIANTMMTQIVIEALPGCAFFVVVARYLL